MSNLEKLLEKEIIYLDRRTKQDGGLSRGAMRLSLAKFYGLGREDLGQELTRKVEDIDICKSGEAVNGQELTKDFVISLLTK